MKRNRVFIFPQNFADSFFLRNSASDVSKVRMPMIHPDPRRLHSHGEANTNHIYCRADDDAVILQ